MKAAAQDDRSLLERIQRGDKRAIAALYERYASVVYSIALHELDDVSQAEQIVTDIFIEIWRRPHSLTQISGRLLASISFIAQRRAARILQNRPASEIDFAPECEVKSGLARKIDDQIKLCRSAEEESAVSQLSDTGLEVFDIEGNQAFAQRRLHVHDAAAQIEGMNRLASAFAGDPASILQELVKAAVDLCGAESAGISVVESDSTDENFYHWVATAGQYSGFLGAKLPRYPSACGVTLERGRPQLFRVTQRFFDLMGVQAPTVTDGLLLPWQIDETRGTIWVMAHGRDEAFDREDCRTMQALANFAATGVRLQQQNERLLAQARAEAEAATAVRIAQQIDTPLKGLIQTVYLFESGGIDSEPFTRKASGDLSKLSELVKRGFSLPN